ncbi:MAG: metallophosphoesterase [Scytonematopsis contorta HA4267-MV1]|jgi:hypothetical protein|nr:metallophosphoesterase [Scytonematopsis contorta HA4267-MV1]
MESGNASGWIFSGYLALKKRKRRLRHNLKLALIGASSSLLLFLCLLFYSYWIEPNWIDVNHLQLTLPHLAPEFKGYRIVHISDIHTDKSMTKTRLSRIFKKVNQQQGDLIAITGDFVTATHERFIPNLRDTIGQLTPKDKTVAVLGNHDYWTKPEEIAKALTQNGIVTLRNDVYTLRKGNAVLHIAGVDDVLAGKSNLDLLLQRLPKEGSAILLAHEPDFASASAETGRFDLQLSGHSHAGQVRIPGLKPLALPPLGEIYYSGLYQVGNMLEYTNRGIGVSGIHLRFSARPEITVITLS